jgi:hypothetical protein
MKQRKEEAEMSLFVKGGTERVFARRLSVPSVDA